MALSKNPFKNTGFTLVELVMVVIIVAIIGIYVAPKLFGTRDYAAVVYQNRAISILRNMQTRAMQDTRSRASNVGDPPLSYCYQVNFSATQFGIPANDFITADNPGNDSGIQAQNRVEVEATCDTSTLDTSDPAELFYVTGTDSAGITVSATASRQSAGDAQRFAIDSIRFDKSGRAVGIGQDVLGQTVEFPCTGIDFPGGCHISFNGDSNATVCVETQGYIYACG